MSTFLSLMLIFLAATTSPALENNASRELKYRIELARNQVAIATISIGIGGIDNYGIVSPVSTWESLQNSSSSTITISSECST